MTSRSTARRLMLWSAILGFAQVHQGEEAQNEPHDPFQVLSQHSIADFETLRQSPGASFRHRTRGPSPNAQLPDSVIAPEGEVTVYADFEALAEQEGETAGPESGGVQIYFVNRSDEELALPAQDSDLYFKLEYLDEEGRWRRAQPHIDSFCGNSYRVVSLRPGEHLVLYGYLPSEGTDATVRFRQYSSGGWVSNTSRGRFIEMDRDAAELDAMARREGPAALWEGLYSLSSARVAREFDPTESIAAVSLRSRYQESRAFRVYAERLFEIFPENSPERDSIQALLARPWPPEPQPEALLEKCLSVVSAAPMADAPAAPGADPAYQNPALAWRVLSELLATPSSPAWEDSVRRAVAAVETAIKGGDEDVRDSVAVIFRNRRMVDAFVDTDSVQRWIEAETFQLFSALSETLVRRGETGWLARIAMSRSPEEQIRALHHLSSGSHDEPQVAGLRFRQPDGPDEMAFWLHCARTQPTGTVRTLYSRGVIGDGLANAFDPFLHEPLRDFLVAEAKRSEPALDEDTLAISRVVSFVGAWKREDDLPLFRQLLDHPGYGRSTVISGSGRQRYEKRSFRVRSAAVDVLLGMGQSVPEGIVEVEMIPLEE